MIASNLINQTVSLLQALRDPRCAAHNDAMKVLNNSGASLEFIRCIFFVFAKGVELSVEIRQLSGYVIKNYILKQLSVLPSNVINDIQLDLLTALCDSSVIINNTAANILGKISLLFPLEFWRPMLLRILEILAANSAGTITGCLTALKIMCEDSTLKIFNDLTTRLPNNGLILDNIISVCLSNFSQADSGIRLKSLEILNIMFAFVSLDASANSSALLKHVNSYLSGLACLSADPLPTIRYAVCHGIVLITVIDISLLSGVLPNIMEFMLASAQDTDEEVAMEACEYWLTLLDNGTAGYEDDDDEDGFTKVTSQSNNSGTGQGALFPYLPGGG